MESNLKSALSSCADCTALIPKDSDLIVLRQVLKSYRLAFYRHAFEGDLRSTLGESLSSLSILYMIPRVRIKPYIWREEKHH